MFPLISIHVFPFPSGSSSLVTERVTWAFTFCLADFAKVKRAGAKREDNTKRESDKPIPALSLCPA